MVGIEIMRLDLGGLIEGGEAGRLARIHQVERHFGLAVDHHRLAGGGFHVDAMAHPAKGEFDAVMDQALLVGAGAHTDLVEQRHRSFLEQPGADAAEYVIGGLAFQDDVVDFVAMQQLAQQQTCGRAQ